MQVLKQRGESQFKVLELDVTAASYRPIHAFAPAVEDINAVAYNVLDHKGYGRFTVDDEPRIVR